MFYNLIRGFLYPFIFIFLLFSPKKLKFVLRRLFQDFSHLKRGEEYIWVHCSSVGEVNLTDSLIKKIRERREENILITTFTDTGFETAVNKYSQDKKINVLRFPLDDIFILKRIIKTIKVKYLLIIETEIWPNLINLNGKNSKIILVNGRISNKSFPRYSKVKFLLKNILREIDVFCMQTDLDKERIISLGADEKKVFNCGNLKFDITFEDFSQEEKEELRSKIQIEDRKLFVAGSTRKGEDQTIINIGKGLSNTLTAIVPRHLERVEEIETLLKNSQVKFVKFSEIENSNEKIEFDMLIVDKMGVLRKFYSICDFAFVGGTLVNIGGHSLIEPLYYGKTPIFGTYLQNVKTISKDILEMGLGYKVRTEEDFLQAIENISERKLEKEKIDKFFQCNKNAVEKVTKFMEE